MKALIAIIGGGLAGLTMAGALRRAGIPFRLFEAAPAVGGLASSHRDADGFTDDVGAHFITNRLAGMIGVGAACVPVPRYGESVALDGRIAPYPQGLATIPRFALSALAARARDAFGSRAPANALEWFSAAYGSALANEVALPLVEAWSGLPAHQLSADVGAKMPGSIMRTLMHRSCDRNRVLRDAAGDAGSGFRCPCRRRRDAVPPFSRRSRR